MKKYILIFIFFILFIYINQKLEIKKIEILKYKLNKPKKQLLDTNILIKKINVKLITSSETEDTPTENIISSNKLDEPITILENKKLDLTKDFKILGILNDNNNKTVIISYKSKTYILKKNQETKKFRIINIKSSGVEINMNENTFFLKYEP